MKFQFGDRVRQTDKSEYLKMEGPLKQHHTGTVVEVWENEPTVPWPYAVEWECGRTFRMAEHEIEKV